MEVAAMARVTVEDCVLKVPNRFELVMLASQRAREIGSGAEITVERDNDKNPVIALREIADTDISLANLSESLVRNHQKVIEIEEDEEEVLDAMEGENEWAAVAAGAAESEVEGAGMHASSFEEEGDAEEVETTGAGADTEEE